MTSTNGTLIANRIDRGSRDPSLYVMIEGHRVFSQPYVMRAKLAKDGSLTVRTMDVELHYPVGSEFVVDYRMV